MLVEKDNILQFIPQRPPIVMVDCLLSSNEDSSVSQFEISEDNIFCSDGYFTEPGIIENMAQTAALRAGYQAKSNNEKVKVGFIGAVKKLNINKLPLIGSIIETTVHITNQFGNVGLLTARTHQNGELLAEAEMSIFTQEEN